MKAQCTTESTLCPHFHCLFPPEKLKLNAWFYFTVHDSTQGLYKICLYGVKYDVIHIQYYLLLLNIVLYVYHILFIIVSDDVTHDIHKI